MAHSRICSIEGCGKPSRRRGWCSAHYQRWYCHGDPLGGGTQRGALPQYFHEVVMAYEGDECLAWPYSRDADGYGRIRIDGEAVFVHREVCKRVNGPPPSPAHQAAHSCGKGHEGCVTKRHLRWATQRENSADMIMHGTASRGEARPHSKMTEAQIREIRSLKGKMLYREIAAKMGLSRPSISMIMARKTWAWLD